MKKRIISSLLTLAMLLGTLASVLSVTASAAAKVEFAPGGINYITDNFESKEAKLATMTLMLTKYNYELYYEQYTGEVAIKNTLTGDILMTNPYDVGGAKASENIKNQLLSQIILKYSNNEGNEIQMFSYVEAAQRSQITCQYIKNGIRVKYVMGKQESRLLVPRYIEKSRFEEQILANITDKSKFDKLYAFYVPKDPYDSDLTDRAVTEMKKSYPITEKMAIYVFDSSASEREKNLCESIIKEFCPNYTYEELEFDHNMTEYESDEKNPVQFRMALEYTIDESGLSVRLPANGISFDQSQYTLSYIRILPYIGAASSEFTGYTLIPDGSGSLIRFEDVLATGTSRILSGKLYGQDYAYHTVSGANQQVMRMPIFGLVEDTVYTVGGEKTPDEDENPDDTADVTKDPDETVDPSESAETVDTDIADDTDETAETVDTEPADTEDEEDTSSSDTEEIPEEPAEPETYKKKTGYVAIIEEGESLVSITTDHGGNITHKYNSVYTEFNPRPKDSYNLASSITVAGDATWTVVSERKYTGSLKIRYIMLTDLEYCKNNGINTDGLFDASYVGMALAYRDQLIKDKDHPLTLLNSDAKQIPLYIETLGVIKANEKVLSVPVIMKKALTTFEDIKTITNELSENGITNLIYKLTGYVNGGMVNTVTDSIDIEKTAGNEKGFKDLLKFGEEKGIDIFLDIDFTYAKANELFDGLVLKRDAVQTIDGRYIQKKTYSAMLQFFTSTGLIAISPSVFADIFEDAQEDLEDLGVKNIALGTIGSDLNSDFDEDDPYNREDSKANVVKTLDKVKTAGYNVMMDGGNAYAVKYANHVLNVALESSNYTYASETVPMFGLVYHGYLNFAGSATNTAGDIRHETLKILENGANPYFILVYRNSEKLKEDSKLSSYFSVSYENWKEDLISTYNKLNDALYAVMNSPIKNHEFVIGERVPSAAEKEADEKQAAVDEEEKLKAEEEAKAEAERKENLKKHLNELKGITTDDTDETTAGEDVTTEAIETEGPESSDSTSESEEPDETSEGGEEEPEDIDPIVIDNGYEYTKYTSDNGMIVKVTFENGYSYILNYNIFDITVKETGDTVISALGYIVIDNNGNVVINSAEVA